MHVEFVTTAIEAEEGQRPNMQVRMTLSGQPVHAYTVVVTAVAGTATAADYEFVGTINFAYFPSDFSENSNSEWVAIQTKSFLIVDDADAEDAESFQVSVIAVRDSLAVVIPGATFGPPLTITILANDGANNLPTGVPTITGTAQVGRTLTANTSGIADADGLGTFAYQWVRGADTNIAGATGSTYQPVAADVGDTLKVRVSWTDGGGTAEALTSAPTAPVTAAGNQAPTGAPTITGTAQVGRTLTANTSGIADADGLGTFSHQWVRGAATDIAGATGSTYQPVAADVGDTLKVRVSWTDGGGTAEALTSAATAPVTAADDGGGGVTQPRLLFSTDGAAGLESRNQGLLFWVEVDSPSTEEIRFRVQTEDRFLAEAGKDYEPLDKVVTLAPGVERWDFGSGSSTMR